MKIVLMLLLIPACAAAKSGHTVTHAEICSGLADVGAKAVMSKKQGLSPQKLWAIINGPKYDGPLFTRYPGLVKVAKRIINHFYFTDTLDNVSPRRINAALYSICMVKFQQWQPLR